MSNGSELITAVLTAYKAAVFDKDVEGFASLYDDDVHIFDMWGQWECRGIEAWRAMANGWFSSLGSERVVVCVEHAQGHATNDFAAGHAFLRYTAVSEDGAELRSLSNRITIVLRKTGDGWKIFHEHTSAPIEKSTLQAILERT